MTFKVTPLILRLAVDAVTAAIDGGDEGFAQLIVFSGPVPTSADGTLSGENDFLVTFNLPSPAFGAAALVEDAVEALAFSLDSAEATSPGEASFFRIYDRDGDPLMQGGVGLSGSPAVLHLNQTTITTGAVVEVERLVIGMPVT